MMNTRLWNLLLCVLAAASCGRCSVLATTPRDVEANGGNNQGIRKRRGLKVYSVTEESYGDQMQVRGTSSSNAQQKKRSRDLFAAGAEGENAEEDEHVFLTRLLFEGHESVVSSKGTPKPTPPVDLMKKPTHFGSPKVSIHGSAKSKKGSSKGKGKGGSSKSKKGSKSVSKGKGKGGSSKSKKGSSKGKGKGGSSKSKKGSKSVSKGKGKGGSSKSKKGSSKGKGKGGSSKSKKGSSKGKGKGGSSKSKKGSSKGKGKGGSSKSKKGSSKGKGKGGSSSKSHRFFF